MELELKVGLGIMASTVDLKVDKRITVLHPNHIGGEELRDSLGDSLMGWLCGQVNRALDELKIDDTGLHYTDFGSPKSQNRIERIAIQIQQLGECIRCMLEGKPELPEVEEALEKVRNRLNDVMLDAMERRNHAG